MNLLKRSTSFGLVTILLSSLLLSACGPLNNLYSSNPTQAPTVQNVLQNGIIPSTGNQIQVVANDQTYDGTNVVIDKVISKGPGWLAIHNQTNGDIGPVIGYTHLNDGENDTVIVKIDPKQATPVMYAMLHIDAGKIGVYEYPGPDIPAFLNGQMVSPSFKATVGQISSVTPLVIVHDQSVSTGKVVIEKVVSNGPGWLAIHFQRDGTPGDEIGYTAVKNGINQNVVVTIDPSKATPVMYAMLHYDKGQVGTYEFPGVDTPVIVSGQMVAPTFKTNVTSANGAPSQSPGTPQPASPAPTAESMNMGPTQAPSNYSSPSAPTAATATPNGMGMPATGSAASSGSTAGGTPSGGMVVITPAPSNNPLVKISDQIPQNGTVKVDDVVSSGPGWIVIYSVTNGQPDQPIGHSPVHPGDNQNVIVHVETSKVTDPLYAQLHIDTGSIGVFEFPGPDVPVMLGVKMISGMFKTSVNTTNSANTQVASAPPAPSNTVASIDVQDQPIHDSAIMVHQVVSIGDGWLVIHPQNPDGSPGNFIGFAPVHNGVNTNVLVHLDVRKITPTVFAMLHVNASKGPIPQYPGPDLPVMINGKMLLPSFRITGPVNGDVPLTASKTSSGTAFLADGWGMALYMFLNDTPGKSNCTGDCLNAFRPLLASGMITAGNGVALNKVSVINLPDGTRQVTYGGSPLYYYIYDKTPGDTQAQGLNGLWFLIGP